MVLFRLVAVLAAFKACVLTSVSTSPYPDISMPRYLNFNSCCRAILSISSLHFSGVLDVVMHLVLVIEMFILKSFAVVLNWWSSLYKSSSLSAIRTAL